MLRPTHGFGTPSTTLRVVPLPRFAGEDLPAALPDPPPFTVEGDRRRRWRGRVPIQAHAKHCGGGVSVRS